MKQLKFHKDFTLNGKSFDSLAELLSFVTSVSKESTLFLKSWFDEKSFVEVQTSGSTGEPKKIELQKKYMINSALATGAYFDLPEKTTALLCLSPNYIAGKMMWVRALVLGWHIDIAEVDSNPLQKSTKNYDFSAMVPLQLHYSLKELSRVKKLIVGGGVVSQDLIKKLKNCKTEVFATYGMTETVTHVAVKKLNFITKTSDLNYQILPNVSIDKDSRGCLVIEAPLVSDKVVITNDLVTIKANTQFEWLGRYDSIINSGGIKLIPEEIEKKIGRSISKRFFISSLPDAVFGEKLILIIEETSKTILSKEVIIDYLKRADLQKFEIPKAIYFIPEFIETETQKIQRKKTKALLKL